MSVVEIVNISSKSGEGDAFEHRLRSALDVFGAAPKTGRIEFFRGVEDPDAFVLNIEWDDVEAHMAFRDSDLFPRWRELIDDLLGGKPSGAHFTSIERDAG